MKRSFRQLFSSILILFLSIALIPGADITAHAADDAAIYVCGVGMNVGDYLASNSDTTTTTPLSDHYAFLNEANGTLVLTLHNYSYSGSGTCIDFDGMPLFTGVYSTQNLDIHLEGKNSLLLTGDDETYVCGMFLDGDKASLNGDTSDSLTVSAAEAGIESYADLDFYGGNYDLTNSKDGIYCAGDINIYDGKLNLAGSASGFALTTEKTLMIKGGILNVSDNSQGIYTRHFQMNGGTANITSGYGIYADADMSLNDGEINIKASIGEGLCAFNFITINGGNFDITALADGILSTKVNINDGNIISRSTLTGNNESDHAAIAFTTGTINDSLKITASQNSNGTTAEAYDASNLAAYDYIKIGSAPSINDFTDVASGAWYEKAVAWAVKNGITSGTSATTFSPDKTCTRAEIVKFLYNASKNQTVTATKNPFTDVPSNAWYSTAVLWAVENDITKGTSATTFSPGKTCSRAEVVKFLHNVEGNYAPETDDTPFTDVVSGAWYEDAVLWAVENKITSGTSATTFSPSKECTRAEIVTFLYNYYK